MSPAVWPRQPNWSQSLSRSFTIDKITISELENTQNGSWHELETQTESDLDHQSTEADHPIRGQYSGHVTRVDQSDARSHELDRGRGVILNWTESDSW